MRISIYRSTKLKPHDQVVWRLVVMTSPFSDSVFKKHRFQIAPLWRAFSNGSVFGGRFRLRSVDDIRIRSKTAPFSFENGLLWTGPKCASLGPEKKKVPNLHTQPLKNSSSSAGPV